MRKYTIFHAKRMVTLVVSVNLFIFTIAIFIATIIAIKSNTNKEVITFNVIVTEDTIPTSNPISKKKESIVYTKSIEKKVPYLLYSGYSELFKETIFIEYTPARESQEWLDEASVEESSSLTVEYLKTFDDLQKLTDQAYKLLKFSYVIHLSTEDKLIINILWGTYSNKLTENTEFQESFAQEIVDEQKLFEVMHKVFEEAGNDIPDLSISRLIEKFLIVKKLM